jgi:hypothetical protein
MGTLDLFGPASTPGAVFAKPSETRVFTPNDSYFRDCLDDETDDGTEWSAAVANQWLDLMRTLARGNGKTVGLADIVAEDNTDMSVLLKSVQHLIQRNQPRYAVDSSVSANTITVSPTPAWAEYKEGMEIAVKLANTNTNNTVTNVVINVSALGNKNVQHIDGSIPVASTLPAGIILKLMYDGTKFQIVGQYSVAPSLPKCRISTNLLASLPYQTHVAHTLGVVSQTDLVATLAGGNGSFTVNKAGSYLIVGRTQGRAVTNTATNTGGIATFRLNGVDSGAGGANIYLPGATDTTFNNYFASIAPILTSDVCTFTSYAGATSSGHYNLGQGLAGFFDLVRLGP